MSERIMTAIPFKVEKSETKKYFDRYFFHCIDCGNEYTSHHCTNRTSPYCVKCKKKHDREKAKELKAKREAERFKEIRNMAIDEFYSKILNFEDYIEPVEQHENVLLYAGKDITNMVVKIAEELKEADK